MKPRPHLLVVLVANAVACGSESPPASVSPQDAGVDATIITGVPDGCDPSADPKDAPKCVVNEYGVFVDGTNGADTNAGTKESPKKTITAALAAAGSKPRAYVCEGTYAEHVKVTSALSLYGGFACGAWSHTGTKVKIAPSDAGYALHVDGVTSSVTFSDLDFTSVDAVEPGASSIAVLLSNAMGVSLVRVGASAGKGADGANGASPIDFGSPAPNGKSGNAGANPGEATPNPSCLTSIGGAGGGSAGKADNGESGLIAISPVYPNLATGVGGTSGGNCGTGLGNNGSYGPGGGAGAGAAVTGTLTANGWTPADGNDGGKGTDGQGGGGGAKLVVGGLGGGGGAGGCGGAGGGKGQGGGASIAIVSFQSTVSLRASSLTAHEAGRGGGGGKGQKGQLVGSPGAKSSLNAACDGGSGGIGGSGGGGGGGAGGVSVGILYKGTAPSVDGASVAAADTLAFVTLGQKGNPGALGPAGDAADTSAVPSKPGAAGTAGADGLAKAIASAP